MKPTVLFGELSGIMSHKVSSAFVTGREKISGKSTRCFKIMRKFIHMWS